VSRRRLWVALLALVLVAGAVLAADELAPPMAAEPETSPAAGASRPVSGSWICAVGDGRRGTQLTTVAARPGASGAAPADVEVVGIEDAQVRGTALPPVFPGADGRVSPRGGEGLATWARWSAGPVAVAREWRWDEVDDLPVATIAGPCAPPFGGTWVIPGMSTDGGHEARLRLANPYRSDATVSVGFVTPEGAEDPLVLRNVTVSARSVREIVVNDSLPERSDLAAVVRVASGRLAVEGYQITRAEIGGVDGGSLLSASTRSSEDWTIPWVADREDATSWLWIVNLGERTAPVELTLHTADGGQVPEGLAEVSVPAGALRRVDLRGTLPPGETLAAVTVRSNGAPVVVSAGSELTSEVAAQTAFPVQLGAAAPDDLWVVSGGDSTDRLERLRLVNPGGTPATVSVSVFNGTTLRRPEELRELPLPPGAARTVDLHEILGAVPGWTAFVTSSGGDIVVGRLGRNTGDEGWRFVATLGVPSWSWAPRTSGLVAAEDPGLLQRFGTSLGADARDAEGEGEPDAAVLEGRDPAG
jgi:hypothetical protein